MRAVGRGSRGWLGVGGIEQKRKKRERTHGPKQQCGDGGDGDRDGRGVEEGRGA